MVRAQGSQEGGADRRLQELGIQLPAAPTPFGTYVETVQTGNLLFFSGMLPVIDHKPKYLGRLGKELDIEAGRDAEPKQIATAQSKLRVWQATMRCLRKLAQCAPVFAVIC